MIKGLALYFERLTQLTHLHCQAITCFLVGTKVLYFSSEGRIVLPEYGPVNASGEL